MGVKVLSRLRQTLTQHVSGSSLAGDGLLVRIRSTSIALLGMVTAVGLGLVVFISQQGWPEVFSGPIPAAPQSAVVHNDTIEASTGGSGISIVDSQRADDPGSPSASRGSSRGGADSGLAGSRQVGDVSPAADATPDASQPASSPSPAPPAEPAPAPVPVAAPVTTAPVSETATGGGAQSAGSGSSGAVAEGKGKGGKGSSGDYRGTSPPPSSGQVSKGGSRSQSPPRPQAPQKETAPPVPEYQVTPTPSPPASEAAGEGGGSSWFKGTDKAGRMRH
jgi:hypothetical protein